MRSSCLLLGLLLGLLGCGSAPTTTDKPKGDALQGITLRLAVVDDPALAEEVGRLAAEWKARTGSELTVAELKTGELDLGGKPIRPEADVVFYPTWLVGPLAEQGWLAPLPTEWRAAPTLAWEDFLELSRQRECAWGEQVVAAPLGSPGLLLLYRRDAFQSAGLAAPKTWLDYQKAVEHFRQQPIDVGAAASLEPLAEGWAGATLLARAAASVRHPHHYSDLFDVESMRPLIDGPPFVAALEELKAASPPAEFGDLTPPQALEHFLAGRGALALTWLPPGGTLTSKLPADAVGMAEVPGATRVFDLKDLAWQDRAATSVPLLSVNGRLGSVLKGTAHEAAALRLLAALCSSDWGVRVSRASDQTGPSRRSQLAKAETWLPRGISASAASDYREALSARASRTQGLHALRIPGRERYLASLDRAVRETLAGAGSPSENLARAAQEWSEITASIGRESQRKAYQRSLGLEP